MTDKQDQNEQASTGSNLPTWLGIAGAVVVALLCIGALAVGGWLYFGDGGFSVGGGGGSDERLLAIEAYMDDTANVYTVRADGSDLRLVIASSDRQTRLIFPVWKP